ncbi:NACHT domain-containing protein [Streptomyces sp. Q6]|uniref:NACHT domain-containing protein n=1 Tax=Streptomyces citrinus TaxID=3118173 RepID=A0ACD5AHZ8_9ACTN
MSAELAALRLGQTVARAAAQLWLGGRRRTQERTLSMSELMELRVPGLRLRRSLERQFEQIADAVAARVEPFLEREFRGLDAAGRQAAIDGVADTFAKADLSDEAVLAADVNAAELVRRITRSVPEPVGLNEVEGRFYALLFAEACEYYVSVVRGLPVFEERVGAELLARLTSLGSEISRVLERLPDRSLFAPDGTDQDAGFRRLYMELVSSALDEVELFRRASDRTVTPARLSVAYVSLRTTGDDGARRGGRRARPVPRPGMSDWEESEGQPSGMRVEAALGGAARVLLRGEAGSGKTTLLRWLAVTAARGSFEGELTGWNGLVPVLVKLREYSGRALPAPEALLDGVARTITGVMPRGWVERQLVDGRVLLLIDGVDELLDSERRGVRDWLRGLLRTYGDIRVVVTSRPAAAGADWLRREDFTALGIDRMTLPDLAAFVRQWHLAVRELAEELPCTVDDLPRYERSLLASLKDRAPLQSLAGTPLLASMLCALHLNRGSQLPRDRMELYRNALHTLVHERDADRHVPSAVDSPLSLGDKMVILRDLAWRLSDNNRTEIGIDQAVRHVRDRLAAMRHLDPADSETVLEQLRGRSGILRSPAEGRLDFVHRTFQEYLAAEEAAQEDRMGNLVGRAHLDLWRETVVMAAGHANSPQREELLGGILDRADAEPRNARALRLLAASCQETSPTVSDALAGRLEAAVGMLLPARRQSDPPALAAVGPSLLRRLPRSLGELTERAAAQTVRTAALIGGPEALRLVSGYADDSRDDVVSELIDAWGYFDAAAYASEVLPRLPLESRWVHLTHASQWPPVRALPNLRHLMIFYPVREIAPLAELEQLESLYLTLRDDQELASLKRLTELREVTLYWHGTRDWLPDLSALASLPHLESLALNGIDPALDLTPLTQLRTLGSLELRSDRIDAPRGFRDLSGLSALEELRLSGYEIDDWLAGLTQAPPALTELDLRLCLLSTDELPAALDGVHVTLS